ncbi:MAG: Eco57I restriction-modification methylase domain-containing protein, partial [Terriglobales bacterium]
MATDPEIESHKEWLGYVQPEGLVVSIRAMLDAGAILNRNFVAAHNRLLAALAPGPEGPDQKNVPPEIRDFRAFARDALGWDPAQLRTPPEELSAAISEGAETLSATYALRDLDQQTWLLLVKEVPADDPHAADLDAPFRADARGWDASHQARFERLLRATGISLGLLVTRRELRLVYAPKVEAAGHITFEVAQMVQVAGRPIWAACELLLNWGRLVGGPPGERLPAILANSRKYQSAVSDALGGQVTAALFELLRGLQAANDQTSGDLLREVLARDPNQIYNGLATTLLRLVFLLFAEDRGLLSTDKVFLDNYSLFGLYRRLRDDAAQYPDTMDQRYGAWGQLLALFRLVHRGAHHAGLRLPPRDGYLFDPARYPFLEGGQGAIPAIPDGTVYRVLAKLLILDGERLDYRTLSVEQIGGVYEAMMGFGLEVAQGRSIAVWSAKHAPVAVNLGALLAAPASQREGWLKREAGLKLAPKATKALRAAASVDDLMASLGSRVASAATPAVIPAGGMVFQPSEERRRSGSHYTPRALTQPIVEAALAPVLRQLGDDPMPEAILKLKVCDPAVGSGAFLVEACRQLGDALVNAWRRHGQTPILPPDEDVALRARREIAQRCLYGVDKNPLAVDLAKLSLWLETLAREHPFTFLDHSIRPGGSLVGFRRRQIAAFNWAQTPAGSGLFEHRLAENIAAATRQRQKIVEAADDAHYPTLRSRLDDADVALEFPRDAGDDLAAAFLLREKGKERESARLALLTAWGHYFQSAQGPRAAADFVEANAALETAKQALAARRITPFHWEIEFPEVFARGGFDVIVGNPPFAGKNTLLKDAPAGYLDWLKLLHPGAHGNSDLVAHFFRRAFDLLRPNGCFGLIATNTIAQGDTRSTGLSFIANHGGTIYRAIKRYKWPLEGAAVVVSVVHVAKGKMAPPFELDGRAVDRITAFLFHTGGNETPAPLAANAGKSFQGSIVLGMGFTFDDTSPEATPLAEMHRLIQKDPRNQERIFPYIGGEELNTSPTQAHHRYVIDFEEMEEREARRWPDLFRILDLKVKPERVTKDARKYPRMVNEWWKFWCARPGLNGAKRGLARVLAISRVSNHVAFAFLDSAVVASDRLVIFASESFSLFAILQSRLHEEWGRFFSYTLKDDFCYAPSDCFETFPFPAGYETNT